MTNFVTTHIPRSITRQCITYLWHGMDEGLNAKSVKRCASGSGELSVVAEAIKKSQNDAKLLPSGFLRHAAQEREFLREEEGAAAVVVAEDFALLLVK